MALFSIGHSNHPAADFVGLLRRAEIDLLVDVRSRPASRFCPWFNRRALETALAGAGIGYRFEGEALGGKAPISVADPRFERAMRELLERAQERSLAMMCAERDPARCHRATKLAAWIHQRVPDARVTHLVPSSKGGVEHIDSRDLESRLAPNLLWPELRTSQPERQRKHRIAGEPGDSMRAARPDTGPSGRCPDGGRA